MIGFIRFLKSGVAKNGGAARFFYPPHPELAGYKLPLAWQPERNDARAADRAAGCDPHPWLFAVLRKHKKTTTPFSQLVPMQLHVCPEPVLVK